MIRFLKFTSLAALAVAVIGAAPANAQVYFDGGTANPGNWEDPVNWTGDTLPTTGVGRTLIAAGDDAALPGGVPSTATANLSSTQTIDELRVGTRGGSDGTLNHSAGTLTSQWVFAGIQGAEDGGGGATGTINLSGSAEFDSQGNVQLFGADAGGNVGNLNVADDAIFRGKETWFGLNQGAEGNLNQTGGLIEIDTGGAEAELRIGDSENGVGGTGNYDVSGGTLQANGRGVAVGKGDGAVGRFRVDGSAATLNTTFLSGGGFFDFPSFPDLSTNTPTDTTGFAFFGFTADANGVSPIDASEDVFLGSGTGPDGAVLVVDMALAPSGAIPLINVGGTLTGQFANAPHGSIVPNSGGREISYFAGDGNDIWLVPEPSCLVLMGLGAMGICGLRRRS